MTAVFHGIKVLTKKHELEDKSIAKWLLVRIQGQFEVNIRTSGEQMLAVINHCVMIITSQYQTN
jgi:hypothetical protein